jgi:TRAP-type C4-dicarboxylate transport system permease small subunit
MSGVSMPGRGDAEGRGDTHGAAFPGGAAPEGPADTPEGHVPLGETAEAYVSGSARVEPHGPLWKIVDAVVLVGVVGMVITVSIQVISRAVGSAVPWTEELTRFLFIYTAFLGMAAGFRHAEHARVAFLLGKLPRLGQKLGAHLYALTGIVFFLVVAYYGWELVAQQYASQETSPTLGLGMYLVTAPIVISAVLAIVAHVQSVYRSPRLRQRLERGEMTGS